MKLSIVFGVCATLSSLPVWAQESDKPAASTATHIDWIRGVTIVDGAAVYEAPNFDSPAIEYLGDNTRVIVSRKSVRGVGGLGLFYRLKANGGKIFYIADTDIKVSRSATVQSKDPSEPTPSAASLDEPREAKKKKSNRPLRKAHIDPETGEVLTPYFTRYMGGALGMVNYSEKFSGHVLSSQMPVYGFRMTGPGTLIDGPPIDLNILFSLSSPDYYSKFSASKPTGFMLFGDIMPMFPFYEWKDSYFYYGLGLMWTYTSYKIKIQSSLFDSQEFRIGADFGVGWGLRFKDSYMIRADAKYYFEKTRYFGYFLSLQTEY